MKIKQKIGVLGGGQLGRMLYPEAVKLDVDIAFLDPSSDAPCKSISPQFTCGDFKDFDAVYNFGKDKGIVTVEIEHVNIEALKKLASEGVKVFPQPEVLETIQDKGWQKLFYQKYEIPTAPFRLIEDQTQLPDDYPFVQKLRKGGYDGKGVQVIKSSNDLVNAFEAPSVIEEMIDFEKELSVIVARNESGEITSFPTVELEFNHEANLVEFLFSPANISKEIEQKAQKVARKVIDAFQMVGILAVELFLTKSGDILVNEVAPRPHNSGHQTIEGNYTSQYQQHLRSILNFPLGDTSIIKSSVMLNLLGEKNHVGKVVYEGIDDAIALSGVYPHIYGKVETKPFRKMGHVTVLGETVEEAKNKALEVKKMICVIAKQDCQTQ